MNTLQQETNRGLLMGLIDGELTAEETHEITELLRKDSQLREEYESLLQTDGQLKGLSFEEPEDKVLKALWKSPYNHAAKNAALWMIIGGYSLLAIYGLYMFLTAETQNWLVKVPVAAIAIGLLILFTQKLRDRVHTYKVDRYKDIER